MDNKHREFAIALLDGAWDYATNGVLGTCWDQVQATGTTWETEADQVVQEIGEMAHEARIAKQGYTIHDQFTNVDLWHLTMIPN